MKYRELKKYKYELIGDEQYDTKRTELEPIYTQNNYIILHRGIIIIKDRYAWDGASGISIDTENTMLASLIHDALYQLFRENLLDVQYRKVADEIFKAICISKGMCRFRAWYFYNCVRLFGGKHAKPNGKITDDIVVV